MKTCHQCHETFPDGLTCPACRAFVPDPFIDDDTDADEGAAVDAAGEGPSWARSPVEPDHGAGPSWAVAPVEPTAGPSWAVSAPATSSPRPDEAVADPDTGDDAQAGELARREAESTRSNRLPVAYPTWARQSADDDEDDDPRLRPSPSTGVLAEPDPPPSWAAPPAPERTETRPRAGGFDHDALFRTSGPGGPGGPGHPGSPGGPADPAGLPPVGAPARGLTLTPATIALGVGAVVVVLLLGFLVLRPTAKPSTTVAGDIAGTCFTYNVDRTQLATSVPCEEPHDGTVLAFAPDQTTCPPDTGAILTTQSDTYGRSGVLCVREK